MAIARILELTKMVAEATETYHEDFRNLIKVIYSSNSKEEKDALIKKIIVSVNESKHLAKKIEYEAKDLREWLDKEAVKPAIAPMLLQELMDISTILKERL
jgi:hypothetical protein